MCTISLELSSGGSQNSSPHRETAGSPFELKSSSFFFLLQIHGATELLSAFDAGESKRTQFATNVSVSYPSKNLMGFAKSNCLNEKSFPAPRSSLDVWEKGMPEGEDLSHFPQLLPASHTENECGPSTSEHGPCVPTMTQPAPITKDDHPVWICLFPNRVSFSRKDSEGFGCLIALCLEPGSEQVCKKCLWH